MLCILQVSSLILSTIAAVLLRMLCVMFPVPYAGVEPDFVLVSCSGAARPDMDAADMSRIVAAKRRGEELLRSTGLGYTVIRPGPLVVSWVMLLLLLHCGGTGGV